MTRTLIKHGTLVLPEELRVADLHIANGRILAALATRLGRFGANLAPFAPNIRPILLTLAHEVP